MGACSPPGHRNSPPHQPGGRPNAVRPVVVHGDPRSRRGFRRTRAGAPAAPPPPRARARRPARRGRRRAGPASTCGCSWSRNSSSSPVSARCAATIRGLSDAATIAPCRPAWAWLTSLQDGSGRRAGLLERGQRRVHGLGQAPAVALEREVRRLELERGAQLVEPAHVLGPEAGDASRRGGARSARAPRPRAGAARRAACAGRRRSARPARARAAARRRPGAPSRISRRRSAASSSRGRGALEHQARLRDGRQRRSRRRAARAARAPPSTSAAPSAPAAGHALAEHEDAERRGRHRLQQRDRRRLGGVQPAQPAGEQHVGDGRRHDAEEEHEREPPGAGEPARAR